jgi:hypothetical protein
MRGEEKGVKNKGGKRAWVSAKGSKGKEEGERERENVAAREHV